jgi:hypothetical protein
VCGVFAGILTGGEHRLPHAMAAEVTLRAPTPLERKLSAYRTPTGLSVQDGDTLIAQARCVALSIDVPPAPSYAEAERVRAHSPCFLPEARFPGHTGLHPFCFCCGVENEAGMQVHAAALPGNALVAAAWPTRAEWAGEGGCLPPELVWTALDCPGQFAFYAAGIRTGMLGRLCARIESPVGAGERCVVTGWRIGIEGSRHFAGTAVFGEDGRLCAYAKAVWVGRKN